MKDSKASNRCLISFEANMYMQMLPCIKYKDIYMFFMYKTHLQLYNLLHFLFLFLSSYLFPTIKKIVRFWKTNK